LLREDNNVADFFEFENIFGLAEAFDSAEEACRGLHLADFMRAKQQFSAQYSIEDLMRMAQTHRIPGLGAFCEEIKRSVIWKGSDSIAFFCRCNLITVTSHRAV